MRGKQFLRTGFSYLLIGDYEQALNAFAKAVEAEPDNAAYAFHGSVTAWRNNHPELAKTWAQRAVDLEPANELYQEHLRMIGAQTLLEQAQSAFSEGEHPTARELLDEALTTDPLNEQARTLQDDINSNQGVNDV